MMWAKIPSLVVGAVCLIGVAASPEARAGLLVDTLPGANVGTRTFNTGSIVASESFTGASQLGDFALDLKVAGTSGSLILSLWTDQGGGVGGLGVKPTSDLGTIATITDLALKTAIGATGTEGLINISHINALGFATGLNPANTYWVQVGLTGGPFTNLSTYLGATDAVGTTSYYTTSLQSSPPWMQTCISSDSSCVPQITNIDSLTIAGTFDAPEPASLALLGGALAALGLLRRRLPGNKRA